MADKWTVKDFNEYDNLTYEDWKKIWGEGQMGSTSQTAHIQLVNFCHLLLPEGSSSVNVFLPLCGNSFDLLWLARKGANVVGSEFLAIACERFFKENNLSFVIDDLDNIDGHIYRCNEDGLNIRIFQCDHFLLTPQLVGCKFDAVWDRGAFNAVALKEREKYIKHMITLVTRSAAVLVAVSDYQIVDDGNEDHGIPPTATDSVVVAYQPYAIVKKIDEAVTARHEHDGQAFEMCELLFDIQFK